MADHRVKDKLEFLKSNLAKSGAKYNPLEDEMKTD
jgi:hypothetical protein